MKKKAIVVDLDGTLCNIRHRLHLFIDKKYDEFHSELVNDPHNQWCVDLIRAMKTTTEVIFVSARPDAFLDKTRGWLERFGFDRDPIFMRKDGDWRRDAIIKAEIYKEFIHPHYDILFAVDDRQHVVDMWRGLGITCLQCAPGNY